MNEEKIPSETSNDVDHFNRWAESYERSIMQQLYFGPVHEKMLKLLTAEFSDGSPSNIMDIGCGTGRFLRRASTVWPHAQLTGVDPAPNMILEAIRLNPKITFMIGFAEHIPLSDASADIVVSSLSFHHWADHQQGIHEIARVLRPNGFVCLADHSLSIAKYFGEKVKTGKEIRVMMENAGLDIRRQAGMSWRLVRITLAKKG